MALVTGPLHSDTASGTVGKSMTFSTWKGRAYVRQCVTPTNPKSSKQVGVRLMLAFLATAWNAVKTASAASWKTLADASSISEFNAYIQANLASWQNTAAPTATYPAAKAAAAITVTTQTVAGGVGLATIAVTPSSATSSWGIIVFRGVTGFTPSWANAVAIVPTNGTNPVTITDTPKTAGTYAYRTAVFTLDGTIGTIHAEGSAVVTQ